MIRKRTFFLLLNIKILPGYPEKDLKRNLFLLGICLCPLTGVQIKAKYSFLTFPSIHQLTDSGSFRNSYGIATDLHPSMSVIIGTSSYFIELGVIAYILRFASILHLTSTHYSHSYSIFYNLLRTQMILYHILGKYQKDLLLRHS